MTVQRLLDEYGIETDDVRYYLAKETTARLLGYHDSPEELTELIRSGRLGDDLYEMEERYLRQLEEDLTSGRADEARVRTTLEEIRAAKITRRRRR